MVRVTAKSIRDGVVLALSEMYPDLNIYDEEIPQGFKSPCFFVKLLTMSQDQELGRRHMRSHNFDIHFFPTGPNYNSGALEVAESLYESLRFVEIDGAKYMGTAMNHEIVDRVLHFFVDYNFLAWLDKALEIKMAQLTQEGTLKDG